MRNYDELQIEMNKWQQHNFPGRDVWQPLVGLGEELGELACAEKEEDIKDALADCMIYLADFCNGMGYSIDYIMNNFEVIRPTWDDVHRDMMVSYGNLCHSFLKQTQRIRMHEPHQVNACTAIVSLISYLGILVEDSLYYTPEASPNEALNEIVWKTWDKVKTRDWQKDPNTAHEATEDAKTNL